MMFQRKPEEAMVSVHCGAEECVHNTVGRCQKDYIVVDKWGTCDDLEEEEEED